MKLVKSSIDKQLSGVCSGIAKYLGWPSFLVRILFLIATVSTGIWPGIIAYILLTVFMPKDDYFDID